MTNIDQVSNMLGKLEQAAESAEKHRREMTNKLDQVLLLIPTVTQLAETISHQEDAIKKNAEKIDNLEKINIKFASFISGVGFVGGVIGSFVMKYFLVLVK